MEEVCVSSVRGWRIIILKAITASTRDVGCLTTGSRSASIPTDRFAVLSKLDTDTRLLVGSAEDRY